MDSALTNRIIACAIDVHRALGPGLLESTYRACFVHELESQGLRTRCEAPIPIVYKEVNIETSYSVVSVVSVFQP